MLETPNMHGELCWNDNAHPLRPDRSMQNGERSVNDRSTIKNRHGGFKRAEMRTSFDKLLDGE